MLASSCDYCGSVRPIYYDDRTNHRALCKPCYLEPPPMTEAIDTFKPQTAANTATRDSDQLAAAYLAVLVTTDEQAVWAVAQAGLVKQARQALEAERDSGAKPAYAIYKKIRGWFEKPIGTLETIERHLLGQAQAHKRRREDETRAALTAATTQAEVASAVAAVVPTLVQEREHWVAEVVDEALIPREYWTLDMSRLNAIARARGIMPSGTRAVNKPVAVNR